jgi:predicted dehydrogenase
MSLRIAAIGVSHWHSLYDAAYLRRLARMPDVQLVGLHDPNPQIAAQRSAAVGNLPIFTDYAQMLGETHPDFVLALGDHRAMATTAHYLLDHGYPFLMEKPMGYHASQVRSVAEKAAATRGFAAVSLPQRLQPFAMQARQMLAEGRFGPLSHLYIRLNRPSSARYLAWDSPWMLAPALSGGGCLRNLGPHGLDIFLWLTGESAQVTGAQLSWRALEQRVEDYATVLLRSESGVLGTLEVGNTFPGDGTDGEWKIAGRDAILVLKDNVLRVITTQGTETLPATTPEPPYMLILRQTLEHWQRGAPPPVSVHDCYRAVQLIDQAYEIAGQPYGTERS